MSDAKTDKRNFKSRQGKPAKSGPATNSRGRKRLPTGQSSSVLLPKSFITAHLELARERRAALAKASKDYVMVRSENKTESKNADPRSDLRILMGKIFHRGYRYRCNFMYQGTLQTNGSAGKYNLRFLLASGTPYGTLQHSTIISNLAEWGSINAIFDEFFLHRTTLRYVPINRYSANSTANTGTATAAGQPGFVNTLGMAIAGYQHNQASPADSATSVSYMLTSSNSAWVDSGSPWSFSWQNDEKFDPDGPVGDQTTSASTQSWLNVANYTNLGGYIAASTAEPTGASALIGTLYEAAAMGHLVMMLDISFRVRS